MKRCADPLERDWQAISCRARLKAYLKPVPFDLDPDAVATILGDPSLRDMLSQCHSNAALLRQAEYIAWRIRGIFRTEPTLALVVAWAQLLAVTIRGLNQAAESREGR